MLAPVAYVVADLVVRALPLDSSYGLARALARLAFALKVPARARVENNLRQLLDSAAGPRGADVRGPGDPVDLGAADTLRARARESFEHFALSFVDFLRLGRLEPGALPQAIEVRGAEHLAAALRSGRGVIVLSAHMGNWEWGAAYLASLGTRVHVAARPHPSRWVEDFFSRRRRACGVTRLLGRPLWLSACRALRDHDWVALTGDRRATDFSGSWCAWAAALSRRTGALVLPAIMLRLESGRYAACFEPPLSARACREGACRNVIRRYLERHPGQWFAFEPLPEGLA